MKRLLGFASGLLVTSALLTGTSSAQMQSSSGDTCTATGAGTSYTLNITVPSGAPPQYGFAFGANGATVTNIDIGGTEGTLSSQSLPAKTTSAWITVSPILPGGSSVASVATSAPVSGGFTVVPASAAQPTPTYLDPINCAIARGSPPPSHAFTVDRHVAYSATAHGWRLVVTIPGAGTVSAKQLEPTVGTSTSKSVTAKSLVQARNLGLKSAGKVTLTLKPTAAGQTALNKNGSIKLKLNVVFDPKGGTSGSKILSLTLKK
jgi:hypothetical protein